MGLNEAVWCSMVLLLVGFGRCDLNQDKAECSDKLLGLASCLSYVGGESKAPTLDCCSGLKGVIDKSKRCLCILIKDRDDPNLGLNINVTLALNLPTACHTPTNITQCVDLLHLPPNSPEAKEFEGYEKALKTNSSAPASSASNATHGAGKGTTESDGGWGKKWLITEACGILPFVLVWHLV
ncbi:protein YLS3 [Abrus precatorius]|uniref:Protein YLS3 n=1 Tax=Abrus precatorius TaxID=3816 RepID=A0A8B8KV08_ABRPR|nr:protein YLS3 [Abrus precatorius]